MVGWSHVVSMASVPRKFRVQRSESTCALHTMQRMDMTQVIGRIAVRKEKCATQTIRQVRPVHMREVPSADAEHPGRLGSCSLASRLGLP